MYVCGIKHLENLKETSLVFQFLSFQQDIQNNRKQKLSIIKFNGHTVVLCTFYMEYFCIYYFRLALQNEM